MCCKGRVKQLNIGIKSFNKQPEDEHTRSFFWLLEELCKNLIKCNKTVTDTGIYRIYSYTNHCCCCLEWFLKIEEVYLQCCLLGLFYYLHSPCADATHVRASPVARLRLVWLLITQLLLLILEALCFVWSLFCFPWILPHREPSWQARPIDASRPLLFFSTSLASITSLIRPS